MQIQDIFYVLQWWFMLFVIGAFFLPFTRLFFAGFVDAGYSFAKTLGVIVLSYVLLVLGIFHIVPFTQPVSILVFLIIILLTLLATPTLGRHLNRHKNKSLFADIKTYWKIILFEELLFLAAIFFFSYIRAFAPEIHGLEKYMDFGFVNSILRGTYFPPKDMWLPPNTINYYYFGHLVTAVLTKISGISSSITFNLMVATVFALCVSASFSLGLNLYSFLKQTLTVSFRAVFAGLLTLMLVSFAGNLHILYAFFKPYATDNPVPLWQLVFAPENYPNSYWYPNATRFIYHTIHEFPIYSWVVSDLHGHVLDIPFVLLTIGLLLATFITYTQQKKIPYIPLGLIGFLLAVMWMTNAWDGIIYFLLSSLVALSLAFLKTHKTIPLWERLKAMLPESIIALSVLGTGFILFTMPFTYFFKPFVSGIGVMCAPSFLTKIGKIGPLLFEAGHCQHSPWWQLLTLYGFFFFFVIAFIIFLTGRNKVSRSDLFVLLLIIIATLLIVMPEFIYLKDIYPTYYRANTMFKLVFQSFIMLSIASAYIIVRLVMEIRHQKYKLFNLYTLFFLLAFMLTTLVMLYPINAIMSYYGNLKTYHGLNGTAYLASSYPQDYRAIRWLNYYIHGQPVILEAVGESYTDYARISANTGLPTVVGWPVHEWLWRGSYDIPAGRKQSNTVAADFPAPRITDVKTLYETENLAVARQLIKKYHIRYVFIGDLEYQKYPELDEEKFSQLGTLVFKDGKTKIYQIHSN